MNRVAARATEHLKSWVSEVIDKYHETEVNPAQVKLLIWDEIQTTLFSLKPKHFQDVLWLRVAVPNGDNGDPEASVKLFEIIDGEVLASRFLGPRESGDQGVFYITVLAGNIREAVDIVDCLVNEGYNVRDWSYGANRR